MHKNKYNQRKEVSKVLACDVGVDCLTSGHRLTEEELSVVVFLGTRGGIHNVLIQHQQNRDARIWTPQTQAKEEFGTTLTKML